MIEDCTGQEGRRGRREVLIERLRQKRVGGCGGVGQSEGEATKTPEN